MPFKSSMPEKYLQLHWLINVGASERWLRISRFSPFFGKTLIAIEKKVVAEHTTAHDFCLDFSFKDQIVACVDGSKCVWRDTEWLATSAIDFICHIIVLAVRPYQRSKIYKIVRTSV